MTYSVGSTVLASDYNTFVGNTTSTTSGEFNYVWGPGTGNAGYGQTALTQVTVGTTIANGAWYNLVSNVTNTASHQGTTITSRTPPPSGNTIAILSNLGTDITSVTTNRLNAATQGSSLNNSNTSGASWSNVLTFTHTYTFANTNAARYFFNAGGQLKLTITHSDTSTAINTMWNQTCSNLGTIVMSSPTTASAITIAGNSFIGVTKVGGGGSTSLNGTNGFYAWNSTPSTVFTMTAINAPVGYTSSTVSSVVAYSGSVVTVTTSLDNIPNGLPVASGTVCNIVAVHPETTYLANTWGTVTVSSSSTSV